MSKATSSNAAKGSPCLTRGRPSVWTHWPTIPDPTWAHACCLAGWPLEGSATTSIAPLRRFQPSEVCPGRPAGVASAGKEEIAASGHGPQTFLEAQGAQPVRTPGPCVSGGGWVGGSLPLPSWCLSLARLGPGRFGGPGTAGRPGQKIPSGLLRQSAREGGGTLTASPEAKGNLPRDPL